MRKFEFLDPAAFSSGVFTERESNLLTNTLIYKYVLLLRFIWKIVLIDWRKNNKMFCTLMSFLFLTALL